MGPLRDASCTGTSQAHVTEQHAENRRFGPFPTAFQKGSSQGSPAKDLHVVSGQQAWSRAGEDIILQASPHPPIFVPAAVLGPPPTYLPDLCYSSLGPHTQSVQPVCSMSAVKEPREPTTVLDENRFVPTTYGRVCV
ncbi:uncharacterized protein LOC135384393 [Ornithodoros turicata]|uniref:uncharacterized protein LOC135384393 n=1 Tax=Ornithodoros turicata TaxID=34597 RepID=UPI00313A45F1